MAMRKDWCLEVQSSHEAKPREIHQRIAYIMRTALPEPQNRTRAVQARVRSIPDRRGAGYEWGDPDRHQRREFGILHRESILHPSHSVHTHQQRFDGECLPRESSTKEIRPGFTVCAHSRGIPTLCDQISCCYLDF